MRPPRGSRSRPARTAGLRPPHPGLAVRPNRSSRRWRRRVGSSAGFFPFRGGALDGIRACMRPPSPYDPVALRLRVRRAGRALLKARWADAMGDEVTATRYDVRSTTSSSSQMPSMEPPPHQAQIVSLSGNSCRDGARDLGAPAAASETRAGFMPVAILPPFSSSVKVVRLRGGRSAEPRARPLLPALFHVSSMFLGVS